MGRETAGVAPMSMAILEDRAVISVSSEGTRAFLQGLVTNDMDACAPGRPIYAALLTPQGKILFEFIVVERDGAFLLDCAAAFAPDLMKRLVLYRLRAKIDIRLRDDLAVAADWNGGLSDAPPDPRLGALGRRTIVAAEGAPGGAAAYHMHRLALGVPDSADAPPDTVFALDLGLEELHGVSFKKGCYVGQEVTARMKHRGSARRRMLIADVEGVLPPPGTQVMAGGRELGTLATGVGAHALALVRLDRLDEATAGGATITADGHRVTLVKPDWLSL
jgi:folate-binding protein YgfZ